MVVFNDKHDCIKSFHIFYLYKDSNIKCDNSSCSCKIELYRHYYYNGKKILCERCYDIFSDKLKQSCERVYQTNLPCSFCGEVVPIKFICAGSDSESISLKCNFKDKAECPKCGKLYLLELDINEI